MSDPNQIVYLNGAWLPLNQASVSVEDRGFMFSDGVYEVVRYYAGRPLAMAEHVERLRASLAALRITLPDGGLDFARLSDQVVEHNGLGDASVYWQVTRGAARRNHKFPDPPVRPTVLVMAYPERAFEPDGEPASLTAILHPDIRWTKCSIKSVSLLGNVLARQAAADAGADEAIMHRDQLVTEATGRTVCIASDGVVRTHPLDGRILGSITRQIVLRLARETGIEVREEYFEIPALMDADEVIALGTTTEVAAITQVDGRPIRDAAPGPIARRLRHLYGDYVRRHCFAAV